MSALFVVLLSNTIFQCLLHSVWWCCENPEFHKNRSFIRKWKKIPPIRTRKLVFFYIHSFRLISGSQKFSIPFNFVQKMPKKETFTSRSFIRKWKKIPPIRTRKLVRVSSCGRCRRPRKLVRTRSAARAYEVTLLLLIFSKKSHLYVYSHLYFHDFLSNKTNVSHIFHEF
jgi:hypothetical protein